MIKKKFILYFYIFKFEINFLREGETKVAPSIFGDFLREWAAIAKPKTKQKTPKLLGLPCLSRSCRETALA
jgi:hypothetical protein